MSLLEIIAVIFCLLSVVLTIRKNIHAFSTGLIGSLAYSVLLFQQKLYVVCIMQLIFVGLCVVGFFNWKKDLKKDDKFVIESLDGSELMKVFLIFCLLWVITAFLFLKLTNDMYPIFDSFIAILSLIANFYLIMKNIYSWIIFGISDVAFIFLFIFDKLYLSAGLYVIFLILVIIGFLEWNKSYKEQFILKK